MALIAPPRGDYAIAPSEGLTMFYGNGEPDEVVYVAMRINNCGMMPQSILMGHH